ncbi:pyridoxal-phosphate-dependent aminotransferase family protein [Caldisericum exile]|uniref:Aminotransferase n=1 Tax=Caldisericum exile (strain DSM 21853 / NBRC 104410 / AZM16c01) TaxID=511051 RepID=A0A7U6GFG7_CALEA|nr:alanine--glyoxylate aminotransferase family protein [Caldisericum exile]BAL81420.1 aminotransferase [Caldisericum exile AZM16c01]
MMKELLLIPGPTPVSDDVLYALSQPVISHTSVEFANLLKEILVYVKELFGVKNGFPFVITGSGTLGMEIALTNILKDNDNLLVLSHGYFGDRFEELAKHLGIEVNKIKPNPGEHVDLELFRKTLKEKHYTAVTLTHVDTSTGVLADVESISKIIQEVSPETLFVVDGVCATGGVKEEFDNWKIDVILTGSQKALATPPGLTLLAFSERAIEKRKSIKPRTYYGDILKWMVVMEDGTKYFATPSVNLFFALHQSLKGIFDIGLENYFKKHEDLARRVRNAMSEIGLTLVAKRPAPTLSVFLYPDGVEDKTFRGKLKEKGVIVANTLAELYGKGFRIGHMGSVTKDELIVAVSKIAETFEELGVKVNKGNVLNAFLS